MHVILDHLSLPLAPWQREAALSTAFVTNSCTCDVLVYSLALTVNQT